jgi:hypothetical protein
MNNIENSNTSLNDLLVSISESLETIARCMDEKNQTDRANYGRCQYEEGFLAGLIAAEKRAKESEETIEVTIEGEV